MIEIVSLGLGRTAWGSDPENVLESAMPQQASDGHLGIVIAIVLDKIGDFTIIKGESTRHKIGRLTISREGGKMDSFPVVGRAKVAMGCLTNQGDPSNPLNAADRLSLALRFVSWEFWVFTPAIKCRDSR